MEDFDLDRIRCAFREKGINDVTQSEDLKRFRVTGIGESGCPIVENQTFDNMLVCEMPRNGQQYIRHGKKWYRILDEIQNFLNAELSKIKIDPALLPAWDREQHTVEIDYNRFVADTNGWYCLDQDFVQVEGYSKLELCDIYDPKNQRFFHVKQTWGCKSAYLFTQGVTAAQSYRESKAFRDKCREKWPDLFGAEAEGHTVVFGVADEKSLASEFPLNMSYFAKLSLYQAITQLKAYDYETVLAPIAGPRERVE